MFHHRPIRHTVSIKNPSPTNQQYSTTAMSNVGVMESMYTRRHIAVKQTESTYHIEI